jgi:hypothetical protein
MKKLYAMYYNGNEYGLNTAKYIDEIETDDVITALSDIMNNIDESEYVNIYDKKPFESHGQVFDADEEIPENFPIDAIYRIRHTGVYDYDKLDWIVGDAGDE